MKRHWSVTSMELGDWLGLHSCFDLWVVSRLLRALQKGQVTLISGPLPDNAVYRFGGTRFPVRKIIPEILRVWARVHSALYHPVSLSQVVVTLLYNEQYEPVEVIYSWETTPLIGEMHHV